MNCVIASRPPPSPKALHSNKWFKKRFGRETLQNGIPVCRQCHRTIHRVAALKVLGRTYNTVSRLSNHPELAKYLAWKRTKSRKGNCRHVVFDSDR